jgi:ornithine cyclodeaminase
MVSYIDAAAQNRLVSVADAMAALRDALAHGHDPEADAPPVSTPIPGGAFLLMPSSFRDYCGVKVVTSAPGNPRRGLPTAQGLYTRFRQDSLTLVAVLDAEELTLLRTPAASAMVVSQLLTMRTASARPPRLCAMVGTGPQAERHAGTFFELGLVERVAIIGRNSAAARIW